MQPWTGHGQDTCAGTSMLRVVRAQTGTGLGTTVCCQAGSKLCESHPTCVCTFFEKLVCESLLPVYMLLSLFHRSSLLAYHTSFPWFLSMTSPACWGLGFTTLRIGFPFFLGRTQWLAPPFPLDQGPLSHTHSRIQPDGLPHGAFRHVSIFWGYLVSTSDS